MQKREILARYRVHAHRFDDLSVSRGAQPVAVLVAPAAEPGDRLTDRQIEVLQLIADGCSNRDVGRQLVLSEETAKSHVRQILARLGASSRAHAVALGFRMGLVS
jgi:DNA-binding NarL/FixJ family response regulator